MYVAWTLGYNYVAITSMLYKLMQLRWKNVVPWPSRIWDLHLQVYQLILLDFILDNDMKYARRGIIYLNKTHQPPQEI